MEEIVSRPDKIFFVQNESIYSSKLDFKIFNSSKQEIQIFNSSKRETKGTSLVKTIINKKIFTQNESFKIF